MSVFRLTAPSIAFLLGFLSVQSHAAEDSTERPARPAQCLLEVNGVHYFGGDCQFAPLDKLGSFRVSIENGLSAQVIAIPRSAEYEDKQHLPGTKLEPWPGSKLTSTRSGDASWSGPQGGQATDIHLGQATNNDRGCWVGYFSHPPKKTLVCAWDKNERLYLGPTPVVPERPLFWGEGTGMYARITSSTGLDTEHASITAEKSHEGAIVGCRAYRDYSSECIRRTLEDDTQGAHVKQVTLHANCKTMKYTDFVGRNLQASKSGILNLDTNDKLSKSDGGPGVVAESAFEALCPKAAAPLMHGDD